MEQQVTYLATSNSLRVAWPYFKNRSLEGRPMVNKSVKFKEGFVILDSADDKDTIDMLDKHRGNILNGGRSFRKQTAEIDALRDVQNGTTFAAVPEDGILESDIEGLTYLAQVKPSMPPPVVKKAKDLATSLHKRFRFAGVPVPNGDISPKRLRARIIEMLETLEERGIWEYDDTKGKEHTGSGKA